MASNVPPPTINWSSQDIQGEMRRFFRSCNLHFDGPLKKLTEDVKIKYLLIWSGTEGQDIADQFDIDEADAGKLQVYLDNFKNYASPRSNFRVARYKLLSCKQTPGEPSDSYLKRLGELIIQCEYTPEVKNTLIVDLFIFGMQSQSVQTILLKEGKDLTIDKALQTARTEEATQQQLNVIRGNDPQNKSTTDIHHIHRQSRHKTNKHLSKPTTKHSTCLNCGKSHDKGKCPAHGSSCKKCGKMNHWAYVCMSKPNNYSKKKSTQPQKRVHETTEVELPPLQDLYFDTLDLDIDILESNASENATQAFVPLKIGTAMHQQVIQCKVDTGAEGNILPHHIYSQICANLQEKPRIRPSNTGIVAYGGTTVKQHGICKLGIRHKENHISADLYVTDTRGPVLIGLPICRALGLVSLNFNVETENIQDEATSKPTKPTQQSVEDTELRTKILHEYGDVFKGIGCLEGTYKITVDPDIQPVIHPPRRVPISIRDDLKTELDNLVEQGIISPVSYPTDWVNSCVCVSKSNRSIRLC